MCAHTLPASIALSDRACALFSLDRHLCARDQRQARDLALSIVANMKATIMVSNRHNLFSAPCNPDQIVFFSMSLRCIFSPLAQGQPMHRCASNAPNFSLHTLYFLCRKPKASSAPLDPLSVNKKGRHRPSASRSAHHTDPADRASHSLRRVRL